MPALPDKIEGTRVYGPIRIAYTAVYMDKSRLWDVKVVDHFGEVSRDTSDAPFQAIDEMVRGAMETSRARMAEIADA